MTMAARHLVMKDGMIHQVGEPKEVYDEPENVFFQRIYQSAFHELFSNNKLTHDVFDLGNI